MDIAKKKEGKLKVEDAFLFGKLKDSWAKSLIGAGCYFSKITSYYRYKIQYLTREKPILNLLASSFSSCWLLGNFQIFYILNWMVTLRVLNSIV